MAPEFGQAYEAALKEWTKNTKRPIMAKDPITEVMIHIGTQMYADDVSDINVITKDTIEAIADERNEELDHILRGMDMAQNNDKEEHIISIRGKDAVKNSEEIRKKCKARREESKDFGIIVDEGKYLGNVAAGDGRTKQNTHKRIQAIRESFYALQCFWSRDDVKLNIKVNTFKGMIFSTALSGMEAEVIGRQELMTIDKEIIRLARKVLAGRACEKSNEGRTNKAWTNERVRKEMRIATIGSELARRRVKWFKTMLANPDDNVMLRAALSGELLMEEGKDISTSITPWMEQLMEDLTTLNYRENKGADFAKAITESNGTSFVWGMKEIVTWNENALRDYEWKNNDKEGIRTTFVEEQVKCKHCEYTASKQQVAMHASRRHKDERAMKKFITGNVCPLCDTVLACRRTAIQHAERTQKNHKEGEETKCKTKKKNSKAPYIRQEIKEYDCEECKKSYKGKQAEEHVKKHLEAMIKGKSIEESRSNGQAPGVLGMLLRNIPSICRPEVIGNATQK
jgi:hypothetical protein